MKQTHHRPNPFARSGVQLTRGVTALTLAVTLSACGGGDDNEGGATTLSHFIGGTLTGLASGQSLVLQNNGGDDLSLSANGSFEFAMRTTRGAAYAVTVKTQPQGQTCSVVRGSGSANADVLDVAVNCAATSGGGAGGGAGGGSGSGSGSGPAPGVSGVVGEWVRELCVSIDGRGHRDFVRATRIADSAVMFEQGLVRYAGASCTGSSTLVDGTDYNMGTVTFYRSDSTGTLTANWGIWAEPGGTQNYTIWGKKGEGMLCLMAAPSRDYPSSAAFVEAALEPTLPAGFCFVRR